MLWGGGKSSLRERAETADSAWRSREAETRKAERWEAHQGLSSAETSFPLEPWRQPGVGAVSSWRCSQPGSPSSPEKQAASLTAGQSWGGQGSVAWARSSLFPNQGSWKRLRVCNLGWGLTGWRRALQKEIMGRSRAWPGTGSFAAAFPPPWWLGQAQEHCWGTVGSSTSGPTRCESRLHQPQLRVCVQWGRTTEERSGSPRGEMESRTKSNGHSSTHCVRTRHQSQRLQVRITSVFALWERQTLSICQQSWQQLLQSGCSPSWRPRPERQAPPVSFTKTLRCPCRGNQGPQISGRRPRSHSW